MDELLTLIQAIVDQNLWDLHTALPAKIIEIDYVKQKAIVQPTIKERNRDAANNPKGLADLPLIQGVHVIFPSSDQATITFPIKVGSTGLLVFCERSTDTFSYGDGNTIVDPQDMRKHSLNDAFFIPGLFTFSKALGIDPENTVVRMNAGTDNECSIKLTPEGDVRVNSPTKFIVEAANEVNISTEVANITASDSVTIDTPETTCTGNLRVDGGVDVGNDVTTDAGFSANTHKHIGNLGKPTSAFIP